MASSTAQPVLSLAPLEERTYIINAFVLAPMFTVLAIVILTILRRDTKSNNPYQQYALRCNQIVCVLAAVIFVVQILVCNNLIIAWDYTSSRHRFASLSDSILGCAYFAMKLCFYFAFTFHFQSIVYAHDQSRKMSLAVKLSMLLIAAYDAAFSVANLYLDIATYTHEEIGVLPHYHIYVVLLFRKENKWNAAMDVAFLAMLLIDIAYFVVLFYVYVSQASKIGNGKANAIRGLLLAITSCVFFWIFLLTQSFAPSLAPITSNLDIASDVLCLFVLFPSGSIIYNSICGRLCPKLVSSANYRQLAQNPTDNDQYL
mmetsp:Transcript_44020/g.70579  ORF Transcript_44020/g.70579 Transcript_44020/m.70579 type:complete len:315 (+) Transcript_44020:10-954(+)